MTGLVAEKIRFRYSKGGPPVLSDFNLEVVKGSLVVLTGACGSGKSTLCGVLAGIYPRHGGLMEGGRVLCDGVNVHSASVSQRAHLIGMMFQNPDLQFCMDTVENELVFCLENICAPPDEIPSRVKEALAFCGIENLSGRKLHTLSGGEKQKVMLACIAALESRYILLDEPFANIDTDSALLLCERLRRFQKEKGTTMLIVDHRVSGFLQIADELIVLGGQGEIIRHGIDKDKGASLINPQAICQRKTTELLFSLRDMKAGYNGLDILQNVNIDFYSGCMTAVTGASGSGKSTLLAALARMISYKGSIKLEGLSGCLNQTAGHEISRIPRRPYAKQVGIVFQNPQDQFVANTVYEEIAVSLNCRFHGRGKCKQEEAEPRIRSCLEEIGLWEYREVSPYMLSQGQQRRLAVGALLAYECRVLLCDEPTYGQDKQSTKAIMNFLYRLVLHGGLSVIFSTHDLTLAESYGAYHYCCENGKLYDYAERQEKKNASAY